MVPSSVNLMSAVEQTLTHVHSSRGVEMSVSSNLCEGKVLGQSAGRD